MATKKDNPGGSNTKSSEEGEKSNSNASKSNKALELERIRQSLAKRSLNVKFDLLGSDYKPIENIGIGAYGVVCSAIHTKSGDRVAIKKIPSVFEALTIAKRTYREIKILKHFKHDNIICIREILKPKETVKNFKDIYVVFDLMESDLHRIIYSKQELSEEHIRYFLYQILRGLKYIHSANVVHRDLKPSNLLVNEDCHLRIGDFGMARGIFYTPDEPSYYMTQYVATRWYRAPEILLSMLEYGTGVDMWSVGCIFAEMMGRKHLFPGKDYMSQVKLILGVLGTPSETVLKNCQNDILKRIIKGFGKKEPLAWDKLFPKASKKSIDLLKQMLVLNPADRIPVNRALSHRLLNSYHDPDDEPICVPTFRFDFEKQDMDLSQLRTNIMHEIMDFHQPKPPALSFSAFLRPAPKAEEVLFKGDNSESLQRDEKVSQQIGNTDSQKNDLSKETNTTTNQEKKTASKISPVSVDISKLQVTPSLDIEMLSAQSNDGKAMETQPSELFIVPKEKKVEEKSITDVVQQPKEKETVPPVNDKKAGNTISEDTKALVKQALMNATQRRQRAESQGDDTKDTKPVTAAQRQREREEKRKKKKARALEKVKKSKDRKGSSEQSFSLSNQDMELLRRWTGMQKPGQASQHSNSNSPPHPDPSVTPPQASGNTTSNTSSNSSVEVSGSSIPVGSSGNQVTLAINKPRQIFAKATPGTAVTLGTSLNISSNQISSGGTVLIPSGELNLGQTNFIPVIAIPSCVNPGKIEIKRVFQPSDLSSQPPVTTSSSSMQASESTKTLLQNAIFMRNQSMNPANSVAQQLKNEPQDNKPPNLIEAQNYTAQSPPSLNFPSSIKNPVVTSNPIISQTGTAVPTQFSHPVASNLNPIKTEPEMLKEDKLSPRSQGNDLLEFLNKHLKDSPKPEPSQSSSLQTSYPPSTFTQGYCVQEPNNSFTIAGQSPQDSPQPPTPPFQTYPQAQSPEEHLARSNSSPTLLRHNRSVGNQPNQTAQQQHRSSVPFAAYSTEPFSSSFPTQNSFPASFQTEATKYQDSFPQPNSSSNYQHTFNSQETFQDFSQNSSVINYSSQISDSRLLFQNTSNFTPQTHQMFGNAGSFNEFQTFPSSSSSTTPSIPSLPQQQPPPQFEQTFPGIHSSPSEQPRFVQGHNFQPGSFIGASEQPQGLAHQQQSQGHSLSNLPIPGAVSSEPFNSTLLQPNPSMGPRPSTSGTSNPGHRLTVNCSNQPRGADAQADLIALLSKQLSKSQVADIFPPALALTPRGTGAGYGVGMDLDTMLTDAQDIASMRGEQSPLSSSLLADWLDISGNISQADLEVLERELALQSPMSVSYNDMGM